MGHRSRQETGYSDFDGVTLLLDLDAFEGRYGAGGESLLAYQSFHQGLRAANGRTPRGPTVKTCFVTG